MSLHKTEAIILQSLPYGEADKIISFYSCDFGKMRGIAKSARRSRKRFGNTLEICSHVRVTFFERDTSHLVRLEHCDLIHPFTGLREDIHRLALASYFIELANELTAEKIKNADLFEMLLSFISMVAQRPHPEETRRIFEIRLLALLGYQPQLEHCTKCQRELAGERLFFAFREGGVICLDCGRNLRDLVPVSMGTVKTLRLAQVIPLGKITRISFSSQGLKESRELMAQFLKQYLGKPLKAAKFMEEINFGTP
jgi:DNA repair protein RecO (recombination protein O)